MALMFPRLARNFAKNGYYPTDEVTLERTLQAIAPSETGSLRIIDPCAGEGVAIAEAAHRLGRERVESFAVEYDQERAEHAHKLVDRCLRSDLMDTMISRQSFGLLWLNPPYGDLPADFSGMSSYQGSGRKRLEKLFYQRSLNLLQYGGILVFIIPYYLLDAELANWLCNHFTGLRIFEAPEKQFKQVVIFGIRTRARDRGSVADTSAVRDNLIAIGNVETKAEELPQDWTLEPYVVPTTAKEIEHFYRVTLEPEQFGREIRRLKGLWPDFNLHFGRTSAVPRQPARQMSDWHLALSLAAGAITGVITSSRTGRTLIVKGNTYKDKVLKTEVSEDEDGNVTETRIHIDRFVPVIKAWDMTRGSKTYGHIITITSGANAGSQDTADCGATVTPGHHDGGGLFALGKVMTTPGVYAQLQNGLDIRAFLRRHQSGDWGELSEADRRLNNLALRAKPDDRGRLFSAYDTGLGDEPRLWIITEADRSVTTILLPSEY